jgi:hypothetical protein
MKSQWIFQKRSVNTSSTSRAIAFSISSISPGTSAAQEAQGVHLLPPFISSPEDDHIRVSGGRDKVVKPV